MSPRRTNSRRASSIHLPRVAIGPIPALILLFTAFVPPLAQAGVVNLTLQHRSVAFEVTFPVEGAGKNSMTAPDFSPFNQSVAGGFHGALMGASQHSTIDVTPDGVTFTLHANVFGSAEGTAESTFVVEFNLPADAPYTLTYSDDPAGAALANAAYVGPHGTTTLFNGENASNFLSAGKYQLTASLFATNTQGNTQDLTFTIGAASTAVPLPPAVWTGVVVLSLIMIGFRSIHRAR